MSDRSAPDAELPWLPPTHPTRTCSNAREVETPAVPVLTADALCRLLQSIRAPHDLELKKELIAALAPNVDTTRVAYELALEVGASCVELATHSETERRLNTAAAATVSRVATCFRVQLLRSPSAVESQRCVGDPDAPSARQEPFRLRTKHAHALLTSVRLCCIRDAQDHGADDGEARESARVRHVL